MKRIVTSLSIFLKQKIRKNLLFFDRLNQDLLLREKRKSRQACFYYETHDYRGERAGGLREGETNLGAILPCFWRLVRGAINDIARHTGRHWSGHDRVIAGRMLVLGLRCARRRADRRDLG